MTFEDQAMADTDTRLNDADVQKVIARALELQATNAQALTVTQIREIASELGIPESAVDQALSEYTTAAVQAPHSIDATTAPHVPVRSRFASRMMISLSVVGGAVVLLIVVSFVARTLFPGG